MPFIPVRFNGSLSFNEITDEQLRDKINNKLDGGGVYDYNRVFDFVRTSLYKMQETNNFNGQPQPNRFQVGDLIPIDERELQKTDGNFYFVEVVKVGFDANYGFFIEVKTLF